MKPSSTTIFYLIILSATIIFNSCSSDSSRETSISWDRYGVPHIKAKSTDDLFFAQGWALMQNHANKVLELYGKSRGRASEYWGEQYLQNEMHEYLIKTHNFHAAKYSKIEDKYSKLEEKLNDETKIILDKIAYEKEKQEFELYHHYSRNLHYPRSVIFAKNLKFGKHNIELEPLISGNRNAIRIMEFCIQ